MRTEKITYRLGVLMSRSAREGRCPVIFLEEVRDITEEHLIDIPLVRDYAHALPKSGMITEVLQMEVF